jgi:hypothetical protein
LNTFRAHGLWKGNSMLSSKFDKLSNVTITRRGKLHTADFDYPRGGDISPEGLLCILDLAGQVTQHNYHRICHSHNMSCIYIYRQKSSERYLAEMWCHAMGYVTMSLYEMSSNVIP